MVSAQLLGGSVLADSGVFGADLLVWLVFALGAAMVVGNLLALLRPPPSGKSTKKGSASRSAGGRRGGDLPAAPMGRSITMIAIGTLAVVWSLATLATR